MMQPDVLSTARLLLRPLCLADAPKIFAMSGEPGLRRWLPDQVYRDLQHAYQVVRALAAFTAEQPDPRVRPFVLGIEREGALVGHVGLSPARGSVEIGYAIEQQWQGQGLATEAVAAMARWGVTALALAEVLGIVALENVPSRRVLEKAGFVRSGEEVGAATVIVYRHVPA